MAEDLFISKEASKREKYESLLPQLEVLVRDEPDQIANMANAAAALKDVFDFFWVGFYRVVDDILVLGPFQGPIACTRIAFGKGVCGAAWKEKKTLIVPDVNLFPGHIACSSLSKSEIVVPCSQDGVVKAVLDVDSEKLDSFDETDAHFLEKIVALINF
ncbi:MAG: GAF domain-containing protein [Proteiniphilum sp.]|jgi:L-methionine (R)-S-oxide reductase|nr:GAF domain-containing protein [Proteiniphilum sp.]NCB25238.1 GAF domain-containing protein [Bacteroidia bacterium]MDD2937419.1 GAF domain-containing protein [Proteiniphilum sp.]MDD3075236.1 GAF domain-containing protein [Proteiniphilum sp.]MDD3779843.1 GAF domain-containing protein [Proteiniphilum sp.]